MALNTQMLRLGREALGLTQKALAERNALDQADVSRWERGLRTPNETQVGQLAAALDLPVELLANEAIRLSRPMHRTARLQSKRVERQVDARLELARLAAARLLEDIDIDVPYAFPTAEQAAPADPEEAAETVRRVWRIPDGPIENLSAYIEAAGGIVLRVDFGTDAILAAYSDRRGEHRWCFINTRSTDGARARFSLAHELGHAIMHWDRFDAPESREAEREAHRFAAALLMPRRAVFEALGGRRVTLDDLVILRRRFKVSIQSLVMRAYDVGLISADQRTRLWKQISARGWRTREPGPIGLEEPTTMREVLNLHRHEHRYGEMELAHLTGLPRRRLENLMPDYFAPVAEPQPTLRVVRPS